MTTQLDARKSPFARHDRFADRHNGPSSADAAAMLDTLGIDSLEALSDRAIPGAIRAASPLTTMGDGVGEQALLDELRAIAERNEVLRSFIGQGYHGTITPPVIRRGILENAGWYTQYTPYQAEIAQGRLEMLLNFQTLIADLTGLEVANASLLDEATAAAEAMAMSLRVVSRKRRGVMGFFASARCHPQTLAVLATRAEPLGIELHVGDHETFDFAAAPCFGALVQYPATDGAVVDYAAFAARVHEHGGLVTAACDPLALVLLDAPARWGADIAVGSSQRFGVPMGYGGPHAAFFATSEEHRRQMPGRIIGVSVDATGAPALRMALQTREQHIRRDRATSNVCTAQVLLANVAAAYACYHGAEGLRAIAQRVHDLTERLRAALIALGHTVGADAIFDTIHIAPRGGDAAAVLTAARAHGVNLRDLGDGRVGVALDETVEAADLNAIVAAFGGGESTDWGAHAAVSSLPERQRRTGAILSHPHFSMYRSETEMMRYLARLASRDLSLAHSMIPLGSCTMKLNAAVEMEPITWPAFGGLHPFVPRDQAAGYDSLFADLERWLAEITGFDAVSLQPNAGSQGEYAGLLVIRAYHQHRGDGHRNVCLIPTSAHGTNPASAVMAGMRVVPVRCDEQGNIDVADLEKRAAQHADHLAALMVTYPSTHGVFESAIRRICEVVHGHGGQVYLDGANLNAQVGLCRPGDYGADVCHLNLHKTFCIPHGGGGPGMGPIGVAAHLAPYLPGHPERDDMPATAIGPVSAAPWGSPSILPISWAYIRLMGAQGLRRASELAILNANYVAARLEPHFPVLYRGEAGLVAHECIIDLRPLKRCGVSVDDVAKRLMDFGFHAPTMSWPVAGTMMIEPTESESRAELDRFCDAMIAIREEIRAVERGDVPYEQSPLAHAPHTAAVALGEAWDRPYSREQAAFPLPWVRERKFWPSVSRVDNAFGDRHLVCTCPPMDAYAEAA